MSKVRYPFYKTKWCIQDSKLRFYFFRYQNSKTQFQFKKMLKLCGLQHLYSCCDIYILSYLVKVDHHKQHSPLQLLFTSGSFLQQHFSFQSINSNLTCKQNSFLFRFLRWNKRANKTLQASVFCLPFGVGGPLNMAQMNWASLCSH